ncbi:hypothetical protein NK270_23485, partial [Salmonella enterica]|uniref:hypothetical protein n=1 Tax=Salmonella enterica TaxID=28901 RepID=UPI0022B7028B
PMRLEYQRRSGVFAYLGGKLPAGLRRWLGLGGADAARRAPVPTTIMPPMVPARVSAMVPAAEATERTPLVAAPAMPMPAEPSPVRVQ